MKKIYAKLKNDQTITIFNDADTDNLKDIYTLPNVANAVPFEVNPRVVTEGQWYFILLTEEQKEEMLGAYALEGSAVMPNPGGPDSYDQLKVIYMVDGEDVLFTKITSRHVSGPKKYVTFGKEPQLAAFTNLVTLTGEVDAYWNSRRLYFKKFTVARSLFPGMQKIYKGMTEDVTNEFLSSPMFELKEEMSSDFIGLKNRSRIASIVESKNIDLKDREVFSKYVDYATKYNLDLEIDDGKIALIDNGDINKIISLLGESFYTTDVTGEKREIRTSKKLVHSKRKRVR